MISTSVYGFIKNSNYPEKNNPTQIGNDAWIGMNSIIMNNVTINDSAIVGAGTVVTKDVEAYSVVGGVLAKHIKYRYSKDQIEKLLKIKWWNWEDEIIKERVDEFNDIQLFLKKYCFD